MFLLYDANYFTQLYKNPFDKHFLGVEIKRFVILLRDRNSDVNPTKIKFPGRNLVIPSRRSKNMFARLYWKQHSRRHAPLRHSKYPAISRDYNTAHENKRLKN